jgi:hypothetical protein
MKSITATPNTFAAQRIKSTIPDITLLPEFQTWQQLSVTHSQTDSGWFSSVGPLFNYDLNVFDRFTHDFAILNQHFHGTYMETVIDAVKAQAVIDNVNIGRIRFMYLQPKTCYTLHRDVEEFRYHIPIDTNPRCFFVNADKIERMVTVGRLYRFKTNEMHTAVNASDQTRIHLVFDTY